jgi:ammonia channel protein AmtB
VRLVLQANGRQLGIQVLAAVVTAAWSFCFGFASMWVLKQFGLLKVSKETELGGIDLFKHNGTAYPEFVSVHRFSSPAALRLLFL